MKVELIQKLQNIEIQIAKLKEIHGKLCGDYKSLFIKIKVEKEPEPQKLEFDEDGSIMTSDYLDRMRQIMLSSSPFWVGDEKREKPTHETETVWMEIEEVAAIKLLEWQIQGLTMKRDQLVSQIKRLL